MLRIRREEILGKTVSSISAAISNAESLASALAGQGCPGGPARTPLPSGSPRSEDLGGAAPPGGVAGSRASDTAPEPYSYAVLASASASDSASDSDSLRDIEGKSSRLRAAYASALRCRLEIQYALLLMQKGLSVETNCAGAPASRGLTLPTLACGLRDDLEGALSALRSGSLEVAASKLAASDEKAARIISKIRCELRLRTPSPRRRGNP